MTKSWLVVVALALSSPTWGQTSAGANASSSAATDTSVSAGKPAAHAGSQTSTGAAADTSVSHDGKSAGASANTAGNTAVAGTSSAKIADGSTINAVLEKPVDVKKNKAGDPVTAKVTQNVKSSIDASQEVVIPKGSRLIGHITEAKPRDKSMKSSSAKGDANAKGQADSVLGITFDKAVLKNGQEIRLNASIQAIGSTQEALAGSAGNNNLMESTDAMGAGSGVVGGRPSGGGGGVVGSTVNTTTSVAGNAAGNVGNTAGVVNSTTSAAGSATGALGSATTASGQLTSSARGVVGMQGLQLVSEVSNSAQGSFITSCTRDVKLDSGSQMVLKVSDPAH
jgi:hypothetical protein